MTTRIRIVLLIIGLVAGGSLIFMPGSAHRFTWLRSLEKKVAPTQTSSRPVPRPAAAQTLPKGMEMPDYLFKPPSDIQQSTAGARRTNGIRDISIGIPGWQEFLAQADPRARELFETGMAYLRNGDYEQARRAFQTINRTFPGDNAQALADWAMGLSYYKEGGFENLLLAMDQFQKYGTSYPSEKSPADLADAAQQNIPVISMDLMQSAKDEKEMIRAAKSSVGPLKYVLQNYPTSPTTCAAQAQLDEIEHYLANIPEQVVYMTVLKQLVDERNKLIKIQVAERNELIVHWVAGEKK